MNMTTIKAAQFVEDEGVNNLTDCLTDTTDNRLAVEDKNGFELLFRNDSITYIKDKFVHAVKVSDGLIDTEYCDEYLNKLLNKIKEQGFDELDCVLKRTSNFYRGLFIAHTFYDFVYNATENKEFEQLSYLFFFLKDYITGNIIMFVDYNEKYNVLNFELDSVLFDSNTEVELFTARIINHLYRNSIDIPQSLSVRAEKAATR